MIAASPSRSIAFSRIVTGVIFLAEACGKLSGDFLSGGFAKSSARMATEGFPFWRPVLQRFVLPHPAPFAWAIALGELAIALFLLSGFLVRWVCGGGIVMMLAIGFGSSFPPAGSPWNRFITAWLTQAPYLLLFLIFAAADAGKLWGLDARRKVSR